MWLLGPAGFPEGSGEKSISSSSRQNREACQIELLPASGKRERRRRCREDDDDVAALGRPALHITSAERSVRLWRSLEMVCERWRGGKVGFWGEEYSTMAPKSDLGSEPFGSVRNQSSSSEPLGTHFFSLIS